MPLKLHSKKSLNALNSQSISVDALIVIGPKVKIFFSSQIAESVFLETEKSVLQFYAARIV